MKEWLARLMKRPGVAHLLRANERFNGRLGNQFAGAITYFSVLALVPIIMVVFSILGFVLIELRPDLVDVIVGWIAGALGDLDTTTRTQIVELVRSVLSNYRTVGIVGLVTALYSGSAWAGNLKNAVRAQSRTAFDDPEATPNPVVNVLANLVILVGLLVAMAVTFGFASLSTSLSGTVVRWLGLDDLVWLAPVLVLVPIVLSVGANWFLFLYLFSVLPQHREPWPAIRRGALFGAVGLVVLQYVTSFLVSSLTNNKTLALFGPVITLMVFFNLFARLVLFVAAWVATAEHPAFPEEAEKQVRFALAPEGTVVQEEEMVSRSVAIRTSRATLGTGYVTGAATGIGVGAVVASIAAALGRRRDR